MIFQRKPILIIDKFSKWHHKYRATKGKTKTRGKKTVQPKATNDFHDESKRLVCQLTRFISGISLMCLRSHKEDGFLPLLACSCF